MVLDQAKRWADEDCHGRAGPNSPVTWTLLRLPHTGGWRRRAPDERDAANFSKFKLKNLLQGFDEMEATHLVLEVTNSHSLKGRQ